jgi:leader peptidase (prepilin peptidase)/N-methyltransferase
MPTVLALGPWACALVALAVTDVRRSLVPSRLLRLGVALTLASLALTAALAGTWVTLVSAALAGAVAGGGFGAVALARPRRLGLGDARLAALVALGVGGFSFGAALVATSGASFLAMAFGLVRGSASRPGGRAVPLGPFMAATGIAAALAAAVGRRGAF